MAYNDEINTSRRYININVPQTWTLKYIKQILTDINREIDKNKIIAGEFDNPLSAVSRSLRQKINMEMLELNPHFKTNIWYIYRMFHPTAEYIFFKCTQEHSLEWIIGQATSISKFKHINIIPTVFSDHNAMIFEINIKKKVSRSTNMWK